MTDRFPLYARTTVLGQVAVRELAESLPHLFSEDPDLGPLSKIVKEAAARRGYTEGQQMRDYAAGVVIGAALNTPISLLPGGRGSKLWEPTVYVLGIVQAWLDALSSIEARPTLVGLNWRPKEPTGE